MCSGEIICINLARKCVIFSWLFKLCFAHQCSSLDQWPLTSQGNLSFLGTWTNLMKFWDQNFSAKFVQIFPWVKVFWGDNKWICKSPAFFDGADNHLWEKGNFQIQLWHRWTKSFWNHAKEVWSRNIQEHMCCFYLSNYKDCDIEVVRLFL